MASGRRASASVLVGLMLLPSATGSVLMGFMLLPSAMRLGWSVVDRRVRFDPVTMCVARSHVVAAVRGALPLIWSRRVSGVRFHRAHVASVVMARVAISSLAANRTR